MIQVESFSKRFKNTEAVSQLSFTVEPGEVLGLLGSNGAGKSTTLRAIAGVVLPDSGKITIHQLDVRQFPTETKRLLAYLPDQPSFFEHLTGYEHIRFIASIYQVAQFEEKAKTLIERFQLEDKIHSFTSDLSKGMRQRLGLICSFIHSPKVLLLDEPMTGLDPHGIRILNSLIHEVASQGTAVILSSHLLSILEEVCTKVLVLDHGKSRLYGTLNEIRTQHKILGQTASLEDLFFYATQNKDAA